MSKRGVMRMMVEWPGRCRRCGEQIEDWADAGLHGNRWLHKACFVETRNEAIRRGETPPELRSPEERGRLLEWPMLAFLLMFHFGLGAAIAGWLMIDQGQSQSVGASLMVAGIVVPLVGVAGVVVNIVSRRRIEMVRQALELAGGWKPGR
jgi:hypothetical protein